MIYELKVSLRRLDSTVWRKFEIDSSATFYNLHQLIQLAFDWKKPRTHHFYVYRSGGKHVKNIEIKPIHDFEKRRELLHYTVEEYDEKRAKLSDWLTIGKDRIIYTSDMEKDWEFVIVLEKVIKPDKGVLYPLCTGAKNNLPVMQNDVLVENVDAKRLVKSINNRIAIELVDLVGEVVDNSAIYWEKLLIKTKELHALAPWKKLHRSQMIGVVDPSLGNTLFCSIFSTGEENGITVYVGATEIRKLLEMFESGKPLFEDTIQQRKLLLTYEDRVDLTDEDYSLIKLYNIPFRGKKAWPRYQSMYPGYLPWQLDENEAKKMLLVIEQVIALFSEMEILDIEVPDMYRDRKILVRIPEKHAGMTVYKSEILPITRYLQLEEKGEMAISEFELKRIAKLTKVLPMEVEFTISYLNIPVQSQAGERPVYPMVVIGANHAKGYVFYENVLQGELNSEIWQREFVEMLVKLDGLPQTIVTNRRTAEHIDVLAKRFNIQLHVEENLKVTNILLAELQKRMQHT